MIIRWICDNCNKKWIYPVEKCIYCKGEIVKQKGTKLKVVGITKVTIPSPMHPIIPYNVLLLQDEFENRIPKKTMKDYRIGDVFIEEKAKTKDAVSVVKVKYDIYEAIKDIFSLLSINELVKDDKLLIKPSAVMAAYQYQAVATNPEVIDAVIRILFEMGIKEENIIVAEQAIIGNDSFDAASKSGILDVCKKNGVRFVDIAKGAFEQVKIDGFKFNIFKDALDRKVINVPIMKTNSQIGLSGAMENLIRFADENTQRNMFLNGIDTTLPKFAMAFKDILTIADASVGMQGQGPLTLGEPAFLNFLLGSRNVANLDTVFCEVTMLQVPPYVQSESNSGVKKIEVVGNELDALKFQIKPPVPGDTAHPDIKVIDGKACPACFNRMFSITSKLVGLRGNQLNIVMGPMLTNDMLKGHDRIVLFGDCAISKSTELGTKPMAKISERLDEIEQLVLFKKLLTSASETAITPVDKVRSKMKNFLHNVTR
ncbi:MAG: DUF362 domain-containing protein [Nanoarchaeota archaeon]